MFSRRALAIVNMLLFVMIFTILSGILLTIVSSHTRLLEHHIRRIKGYYAAEAGSVLALDALRKGAAIPPNLSIEWSYNLTGSNIISKTVPMANQTSGRTTVVNATSDYTLNW
jgi:hypothetical protein